MILICSLGDNQKLVPGPKIVLFQLTIQFVTASVTGTGVFIFSRYAFCVEVESSDARIF